MTTKKKKRVYRLSDLVEIANQMGGRIRFDIVPNELCGGPSLPDKGNPELPKKSKRSLKGAR